MAKKTIQIKKLHESVQQYRRQSTYLHDQQRKLDEQLEQLSQCCPAQGFDCEIEGQDPNDRWKFRTCRQCGTQYLNILATNCGYWWV